MPRWTNRSAFVVRPRQPWLEWAARVDIVDGTPGLAEGMRNRVVVYLVRNDKSGPNFAPPIEEYFEAIFEAELEVWTDDRSQWPAPRTFELFTQWIEVVGDSFAFDLENDPIEVKNL